ncbi:MAG: O-antigen ligase family protein [Hyphomonadaceae bacterium]
MVLLAYLPEIAAFMMLFMMATQLPQIGALLILAGFGLVGLLFVFRTYAFADAFRRFWWLLLFPLIAALSGLWSDLPDISFRYGAQFAYTCFVGVLLACVISPRRYVQVLVVALFFFCLACIAYGRQGTSATGMVLIGLTGSKNQMGYAGQLLMLAGVAVLLMRNTPQWVRVIGMLALPLGGYIVWGTNSSTAVLMAFGGIAVLWALWFSERLPPGGRLGAIIAGVIMFAPLLLLLPEAIAFGNHFLFDTLGKDPTLTGRTFLWERADQLIARKPLLGYGFQAIWMGDSTDTIGLKRLADIEDGRQFHFHHQFRIVAVDTGLLGLVTFVGAMIFAGLNTIRQMLLRPTVETSFFFVVFALMVTRAFTDQIIGPFNMHTLLFFAASVYAFWRPERAVQTNAAPPVWQRRVGSPVRA